MTSGVTAGFDVISFETTRLQAVYCILPLKRSLDTTQSQKVKGLKP